MRGVTNNNEQGAGTPSSPPKPSVAPQASEGRGGSHPPKRTTNKMAGGQSINHLLNFRLPPRESHTHSALPRRSRKTAQGYGVWNKEKFVNAQYRFVMKPSGDYTVHFADPDIFFQWPDILQVIIPRKSALATASERQDASPTQEEGVTTCPICLSPPTAPRMTKCGHVFCFPCVLHYLGTSERGKWHRCPICFDSINEKQLKSVKWYDEPFDDKAQASGISASSSNADTSGGSVAEGSLLRLRLMQRPQITTLALPRSETWPSDAIPPHQAPFHFLPDVYRFARFMLATPDYLLDNLTRDLDALQVERKVVAGMKDELSMTFLEAAEAKVRAQMEKASALETPELREAITKTEEKLKEAARELEERGRRMLVRERQGLGPVPIDFLSAQREDSSNLGRSPTARGRTRRNVNPPPPSSSTYYFYQAASGLPIFLHPLDIRILLSQFSSYSAFPNVITVRVDASAEGSIDTDLRKRCKYLGHMPESADVVFVEADLKGIVGEETLKAFEAPLKARAQKRKERGRKDDRAKAKAELAERERLRLPPQAPEPRDLGWTGGAPDDYDLAAAIAASAGDTGRLQSSSRSPETLTPPPVSTSSEVVSDTPTAHPSPGAWGTRSFATAAQGPRGSRATANRVRVDDDEWDIDAEWHEQNAHGGGGRRKKANKMLVLGGGGRRR